MRELCEHIHGLGEPTLNMLGKSMYIGKVEVKNILEVCLESFEGSHFIPTLKE